MKHTTSTKCRRGAALLFIAALGLASGVTVPTSAQAAANTQLSGTGTLVADCAGQTSALTMSMHGSLEGCWYTHGWEVLASTPSGAYHERGTETFVGCLVADGIALACGTLDTTYQFSGKFAPSGAEIRGRCEHPFVVGSGTGGFKGATGRVDMKDDVVNGVALFRGHIKLAS